MDKDLRIQQLLERIKALEAVIAELRTKNESLCTENASLKKHLNKNSHNSSKPPSSDGLSKPPRTRSLRQQSKKKSGGQKGHPGYTLNAVTHPHKIEKRVLNDCPQCHSDLSNQSITHSVYKKAGF